MSDLKNSKINKTYGSIIKLLNNEQFSGSTNHKLSDGYGNQLPLSVSNSSFDVCTNLSVFGNNSISGILSSASINSGYNNILEGSFSGILGGRNNINCNDNSFIIGSNITSQLPNTTYVECLSINGTIYDKNGSSGICGQYLKKSPLGICWSTLVLPTGDSVSLSSFNLYTSSTNTLIGTKYDKTGGLISGNVTISGNLIVNGSATTINNQNLIVKNPLVLLASGTTVPFNSSGILIDRGVSGRTAFIWSECSRLFEMGDTNNYYGDPTINISKYNDLKVNGIHSCYLYDANDDIGGSGYVLQTSPDFGLSWIDPTTLYSCKVIEGSNILSTIRIGGDNSITNDCSTISGGKCNTITSTYSSIGGGGNNTITCTSGLISGGFNNNVSGCYSSISGGLCNTILGDKSVINGGVSNTASGAKSVIGGGESNTTSGCASVINGGRNNTISSYGGIINGGNMNVINCSSVSFIGNGSNNTAAGGNTFIGNGNGNTISNTSLNGVIINGYMNILSGNYSIISNGISNTSINNYSIIGSGSKNTAVCNYTTLSNGYCNLVCGTYSTINNGSNNTLAATNSIIINGSNNQVLGDCSVGGGTCNTIQLLSESSIISGGLRNTLLGQKSSILNGGFNIIGNYDYSTVIGGTNNIISGSTQGQYSNVGGGQHNLITCSYSNIGGGQYNTVNSSYSSILGGFNNCLTANCSFIIGSNIIGDRPNTTYVNCLNIGELPTSDPGIPGVVWRNGSCLMISI